MSNLALTGPLEVQKTKTEGIFWVANKGSTAAPFDEYYVRFSGFFGAHGPHVFAAAPDLLEALVLALPYVEMAELDEAYKPGAVSKIVKAMNAAIAKAKGGA